MAERLPRPRLTRMRPPMTPLIDCVFQLLLFFLLAPNVLAGEGYLTTNLPHGGPNRGEPPDPIYVEVRLQEAGPDGTGVAIVLDGHQAFGADFDGLRTALADCRGRGLGANFPVRIVPTRATRHKWVVRAFDAVAAADLHRIQFAVPGE